VLRWALALAPPAPSLVVALLRAAGAAAASIAAEIVEAEEAKGLTAASGAAAPAAAAAPAPGAPPPPPSVVDDVQRFAVWDGPAALALLRTCLADGDPSVPLAAAVALERVTCHCRAAVEAAGATVVGAAVGEPIMDPLLLSGAAAALVESVSRRVRAAPGSQDVAAAELNTIVDVLLHEAMVRARRRDLSCAKYVGGVRVAQRETRQVFRRDGNIPVLSTLLFVAGRDREAMRCGGRERGGGGGLLAL
jgi:hypothetical protein